MKKQVLLLVTNLLLVIITITSCNDSCNNCAVYGLETKNLIPKSELNTTGTNYANGHDHQKLKAGDTVILESIYPMNADDTMTVAYNVYYEDDYDMSDIRNGEHLKLDQINHLEKAVVQKQEQ